MKKIIAKVLPSTLKKKLRQSNYYTHKTAIHLASTSKRIDICAAQFANIFHLSKHASIEGKTCLEIGSGWVLTHALVCYLLGAKKVIATDIAPFAQPDTLFFALKNTIASIPRDILSPFSNHADIRERFNKLLSISHFNFETLEELGIEYRSPVDFAVEKINISVDFIFSNSVLEHVPVDDVPMLLNNLAKSLNEDGTMIHSIHLEDHQNISGDPFKFLKIDGDSYTRSHQTDRGNRIRYSEWEKVFADIQETNTDVIYKHTRLDKDLPDVIDSSILYHDELDLRISHIGMYTQKIKNNS